MIRHNLNLKNQKLSNISLVLIKFRLYYMHVVKFRKSQKQSLIQFFQRPTMDRKIIPKPKSFAPA